MIGFIAFCQSRSSNTKRGISRHPASVLAPESALASLPSVALSSAQVDSHSNQESKTFVALVNTEGVQKPVPNTCTVAGFEVITIGRFCGDNRGFRFLLCPSPEPESNWLRAILLNRTVRGNGFVSSAASSISSWQPALASNLQARAGRASISVWCRLRFCHRQPEIKSGIETDSSLLLVS